MQTIDRDFAEYLNEIDAVICYNVRREYDLKIWRAYYDTGESARDAALLVTGRY